MEAVFSQLKVVVLHSGNVFNYSAKMKPPSEFLNQFLLPQQCIVLHVV